jgi:hypothetical protein
MRQDQRARHVERSSLQRTPACVSWSLRAPQASTVIIRQCPPRKPPPRTKEPYAITKLDGEYCCEMFEREGWLKTAAPDSSMSLDPDRIRRVHYAAAVPASFSVGDARRAADDIWRW